MSTDDLRAAAELVVATGEKVAAILGPNPAGEPMAVAVEVCRRWLAEHQPDDGELVADPVGRRGIPAWLVTIGGHPCDADGRKIALYGGATRPAPEGVRIDLTADRWLVIAARPVDETVADRASQEWPVTLHDPQACVWVANVRTRGHVRALLRALGAA